MLYKKADWLAGYVTIEVKGSYPERFFDLCTRHQIAVWDIYKTNATTATGTILLKDISKVRKIKRKAIYKIYFKNRKGLPFSLIHSVNKKPLIIGFLLAFIMIFILSNIVWRIDIAGLDEEMNKKVREQLESYGVTEGSFQWQIESPGNLQSRLISDIPELLWIGVKKNGSTYFFEGVEKTTVEEEEETEPGDLVAAKEGVIADLFISKGQPLVKPNDVVYPGDVLVTGSLGDQADEEENDLKVAAEGEVIAEVWYKSEVDMPLQQEHFVLSGNSETKHYLNFSQWFLPIWNFGKPDYDNFQLDIEEKDFYFLKWKLPIQYVKQTMYESTVSEQTLSEKEAKKLALEQAKRELTQQMGPKAEIKEEKILHERVENGKVKITLYYTVLEDIAKKQPTTQGD